MRKRRPARFSDTGPLHNYLWHGVRAFFEEGGNRLYVARVFRPTIGDEYIPPSNTLKDDDAIPANGQYKTDGHARCWLTPLTVALSAALREIGDLGGAVRKANEFSAIIEQKKENVLLMQFDPLLAEEDKSKADTELENMAKKLMLILKNGDQPDTVSARIQKAIGATTDAKAVFGNTSVKSDAEALDTITTELDAKLSIALERTMIAATREGAFNATDESDALKKTGEKSSSTAKEAFKLLGGIKLAAQTVMDGEGQNANTLIALLATAIRDSCKDDAGSEGDTYKKLDAAKKSAAAVVSAADDDTAKTDAKNHVAKSEEAAFGCHAVAADVERLLNQAYIENKKDEPENNKFPLKNLKELAKKVGELCDKAESALKAAREGHYRRAWFIEQAVSALAEVSTKFNTLATAGESSKTKLDSHVPLSPATERSGAILLRARFPGKAGNMAVRFTLNLGQNGLVEDKVNGLTPGDVVWIGDKGNVGKLYLAYPKSDGTDWYFSTTAPSPGETSLKIEYWLNQPPDNNSKKLQPEQHEVRIVTATVSVLRQGEETSWSGLALQPDHRRAGSADSVTSKFRAEPVGGTDARTLPFMMLLDEEVDLAGEVYTSLVFTQAEDELFKVDDRPISVTHQLSGGNDGMRPGANEYAGHGEGPDAAKTGLKAFEDVEDISIVAAPGAMFGYMNGYKNDAQQIVSSLISHAENMKYRIAVLESGDGQSVADVREMRARYDSKYAALYYPWVRVLDPVTRDEIHLPPSGFVAGIYARNDVDRAVYKAPANEVVRGAIGFQTLLNKAQQEVLNPEGVNCFRFFEGRGFRLWGARTISSDPEWKYVNVRRYFAYLERSIDRGTQWAVFEPNGEALWANVRETISDFLYNEWKNGALLGSDPKSAYFVRCDRSTMTQNDLDNGRLVCKIGVAALKPAEFVIFQIGQWTGDRKA